MRPPVRYLLAVLLLAASFAHAQDAGPVRDPSFEQRIDGGPWVVGIGAGRDPNASSSEVARDTDEAREGEASLRLRGGAQTQTWRMLTQAVPVEPGDRVLLTVAARSRGIMREAGQNANANGILLFQDERGHRTVLLPTPVLWGDREWVDLSVHGIAPPNTVRVQVGVFLSMTGTAWFDDVRLERGGTDVADRASRELVLRALRRHLEQTYPFFGMAGRPTADEVLGDPGKDILEAEDRDAFLSAVAAWMGRLKDIHVYIRDRGGKGGESAIATYQPDAESPRVKNVNIDEIRRRVEQLPGKGNLIAGRIETDQGKVGYLWLPTLQLTDEQVGFLLGVLDELRDTKAMILDVRGNGGGNEMQAAKLIQRWVTRSVIYARHTRRDPSLGGTDGFFPVQDRRLPAPLPEGEGRDPRRLVVLQGPYCVSSTEGLLLMAKAMERVTTVGLPSYGASADPRAFPLLPDAHLMIPTWRSLDREGECIEGVGVPPDVTVDAPAEEYETGDPTLERGLGTAVKPLR